MVADRISQGDACSRQGSPRACGWARRTGLAGVWLTMAAAAARRVTALLIMAGVVACDWLGPEPAPAELQPVVSDTIVSAALAANDGAGLGASGADVDVVYVSLPAGTVPGGLAAAVLSPRAHEPVAVRVVDGGFDPVTVVAAPGDTVRIEVTLASGAPPATRAVVAPVRRRPVVVRIDPPPKKRDVPLNATIRVVFSEPIDGRTVNGQGIRLLRGDTPVAGNVQLSSDGLVAEFRPQSWLGPNTTYVLEITTGVTDLDGDTLERSVTAEFTTDESVVGLSQIAFWDAGIRVMSADGSNVRVVTNALTDYQPAWSPDGTQIVFSSDRNQTGTWDITVINVDGSGLRQLTNDASHDQAPAWSPDGTKIAFQRDGFIYVMNAADGSSPINLGRGGCCSDTGPAWSPDGSLIAFEREQQSGYTHIYVMSGDGSGVVQLTSDPTRDVTPTWSPDGEKIAFVRHERPFSEPRDVYVMNADGSGVTRLTYDGQVTSKPTWSPDGNMIAFGGYGGVAIMNADGSDIRRLADGISAAWSPVGHMPLPPSFSIRKGGGDGQSDTVLATLAQPISVLVLRDAVPAPGVTVSWAVRGDHQHDQYASVSPSVSVTNASGIASATWTLGHEANSYSVLAAVPGALGTPVVAFTATGTAATPVELQHTDTLQLGLVDSAVTYWVSAIDGYGNRVPGVPIQWSVTGGGGSITPIVDTTRYEPSFDIGAVARHVLGPNEDTARVTVTAPTISEEPQVAFTTAVVSALVEVNSIDFDGAFSPDSVVVAVGRTVGWYWYWYYPEHNVSFEDDPTEPTSSPTQAGGIFTRRFEDGAGVIRYRCTLHSSSFTDGEVGVVVVQP